MKKDSISEPGEFNKKMMYNKIIFYHFWFVYRVGSYIGKNVKLFSGKIYISFPKLYICFWRFCWDVQLQHHNARLTTARARALSRQTHIIQYANVSRRNLVEHASDVARVVLPQLLAVYYIRDSHRFSVYKIALFAHSMMGLAISVWHTRCAQRTPRKHYIYLLARQRCDYATTRRVFSVIVGFLFVFFGERVAPFLSLANKGKHSLYIYSYSLPSAQVVVGVVRGGNGCTLNIDARGKSMAYAKSDARVIVVCCNKYNLRAVCWDGLLMDGWSFTL